MTATDDADRVSFAGKYAETFDADPAPDFEGLEYDDYRTGPKCQDADGRPCCLDRDGRYVGPGCRHCCPPDAEAIDSGFERWDRPDFYRVTREQLMLAAMGYALDPRGIHNPAGAILRDTMIGHNRRLQAAARRKIDIICDECETHHEAVARYEAWAAVAKAKYYPGG